jgi:O-antigen/teichoic acid export membrane protein
VLYLWSRLPRSARHSGTASAHEIAPLLRSLAPFVAAFTALTIYYKVDVLVLNHLSSKMEVGLYAAAYKFVDIVHALTIVAAAAAYPRLARRSATGIDGRWAGTRLVELVLLAVMPVAAVLWLARDTFTLALFGGEFARSAISLAFLAPAIPALAINIVAGYILGLRGRMLYVAAAYAGAVLLNVGLNFILAPKFGATGVAAAKLSSEVCLAGVLLLVLHYSAAAAPERRVWFTSLALAAACGLTAWATNADQEAVRVVVLLLVAPLLYARFGIFEHQEVRALRAILNLRRRWTTAAE